MSVAGNADQLPKQPQGMERRYKLLTLLLTWALIYAIIFLLFHQMLQVAKTVSPYIGYEVPLTMVSLYISTFIMLIGVVFAYIFHPCGSLIKLVLVTSVAFVIVHYSYVYSVFLGRSSELKIEILPFLIRFASSSGHASLAIDFGQLVILALLLYSAFRIRDFVKKERFSA